MLGRHESVRMLRLIVGLSFTITAPLQLSFLPLRQINKDVPFAAWITQSVIQNLTQVLLVMIMKSIMLQLSSATRRGESCSLALSSYSSNPVGYISTNGILSLGRQRRTVWIVILMSIKVTKRRSRGGDYSTRVWHLYRTVWTGFRNRK